MIYLTDTLPAALKIQLVYSSRPQNTKKHSAAIHSAQASSSEIPAPFKYHFSSVYKACQVPEELRSHSALP